MNLELTNLHHFDGLFLVDLNSRLAWTRSSFVEGDEGWLGPSGKLFCSWQAQITFSYTCICLLFINVELLGQSGHSSPSTKEEHRAWVCCKDFLLHSVIIIIRPTCIRQFPDIYLTSFWPENVHKICTVHLIKNRRIKGCMCGGGMGTFCTYKLNAYFMVNLKFRSIRISL